MPSGRRPIPLLRQPQPGGRKPTRRHQTKQHDPVRVVEARVVPENSALSKLTMPPANTATPKLTTTPEKLARPKSIMLRENLALSKLTVAPENSASLKLTLPRWRAGLPLAGNAARLASWTHRYGLGRSPA